MNLLRHNIAIVIFFILCIVSSNSIAQMPTPEKLMKSISIIDSVNIIRNDPFFENTYEVWFRVPVDHNDPNSPTFPLRAYYSHKGYDRPVLVVTDGYTMYTSAANELAYILDANQITIEHRFFSDSRPKDSIPWSFLTVRQAAADQHDVIQAFKSIYGGKWVSTGISKSGQTSIFHRCFYPEDVDVTVPYVAPLNFSNEDPRVYSFLHQVGTEECRDKIYNFQKAVFKNKKKIFEMYCELADRMNWEFKMGRDRAFDLGVLEFSFAFWQWGGNCDALLSKKAKPEELFESLKDLDVFSFFEENSIETSRPFFFQAMTEIGMYGYEVAPFKKYLKDKENVKFYFTMPEGYENMPYNYETMQHVSRWIQESGNKMLYIYGGNDAWSSTAVDPGNTTNAVIMFNPGGSHATRIKSFPPAMQDSIYQVLGKWLGMDVNDLRSSKR
ncbi:MAG: S28 family serine protease [Bacteroidales bacterium]|nr:S28 family serine protease [Bacteroidales bacterium]